MAQEKKYLKTIQEFEKALDEGKVVYEEVTGIEMTKSKSGSFLFQDKKRGEKYVTLHPFLSSFYKPYILETKLPELKIWHLYENNYGDKVLICRKDEVLSYKFVGVSKHYDENLWIDAKGNFASSSSRYKGRLVKELADLSKFFE